MNFVSSSLVLLLTGTKISKYFKAVANEVYPDITKAELKEYSAHMIRVSACVILQIADKKADFIKMRLRWESDAYRVYLRNTTLLARRHLDAGAAVQTYALSARNLNPPPQTLPAQIAPSEMGVYEEII